MADSAGFQITVLPIIAGAAGKLPAILAKLKKMKVYQDIVKMKFSIPNENLSGLDKIEARLERSMDQMEALYA